MAIERGPPGPIFHTSGRFTNYRGEVTMTETTTTTEERTEAYPDVRKPCRARVAPERPCWRPATEADIGETEPTLCFLNMQLRRRDEDLDGWLHALEAMRDFMHSRAVDEDPHSILRELAIGWYDTVTEKAAEAAHKQRVAEFLAARGPNDAGPKNAIMREYGAHLYVRSDALTDAFAAIIDERELSETERLVTIVALKEASERVNGEYEKFREGQGLRG
jgi:hypothetical protein